MLAASRALVSVATGIVLTAGVLVSPVVVHDLAPKAQAATAGTDECQQTFPNTTGITVTGPTSSPAGLTCTIKWDSTSTLGQSWSVPSGVDSLSVVVSGAKGGDSWRDSSGVLDDRVALGGGGAKVEADITNASGKTLKIYAGRRPAAGVSGGYGTDKPAGGEGYGDGGSGGSGKKSTTWTGGGERYYAGGGGGGASAITTGDDTALVVGGGGGGAGGATATTTVAKGCSSDDWDPTISACGNGSAQTGYGGNGSSSGPGTAGTNSLANVGNSGSGPNGGSGYGTYDSNPTGGGGGGGGFFGGGAGAQGYYSPAYGGGAGSSYPENPIYDVGSTSLDVVNPDHVAINSSSGYVEITYVVAAQPTSVTSPTVSGTAALGQVLAGTPGTWNDNGSAIDDTEYQWQYDDTVAGPWSSASDDTTSLNFTISDDTLAGQFLRLGVRVHNVHGWSSWAYSTPSLQVTTPPSFTAQTPPSAADDSVPYVGYTFVADGYRMTYAEDTAGLTGLPTGMILDSSTGQLSGTPTQQGTFTYRVKASNTSGEATTPTLTLTVSPLRLSLTATGAEAPGNASIDDTLLNPQPKVQIADSSDTGVSVSGVVVSASIASGTGTLADDTAVTDGNGLATFTGLRLNAVPGSYVLRFAASGYTSVDDTVQMLRSTQTVTLSSIGQKTFGVAPFPISATTSSGLTASFNTTTPSVCSVSGNEEAIDDTTGARVTILGAGPCTILASQSGDDTYGPAVDDSETFTVLKAQQAPLTLVAPATATAGESVTLRTTGGSGPGVVTFSATSGPCSVPTGASRVELTGTGSCVVTASKPGGDNYDDTTSSPVTITVASKSSQTVAFTSTIPASPISGGTYSAAASATSNLSATIGVQGGSTGCTATTGTSPVIVTFTGAGTCVLEAAQAGDGSFDAASPVATQTIRVYANASDAAAGPKNQSITFGAPSYERIGTPDFRLTATASSGLAVTYSSSTSATCTVTGGGIVHLVAAGPCTITASQAGDASYASADSVTKTFPVTAAVPSAPRILSSSAGAGAATLSFAAPDDTGGSPILAYSIFATPTSGSSTVSSSACTASPCTITGLTDDSTYTIAIAAISAAGVGPYSLSTPQLTPKSCSVCVGAPGGTLGGPGGPAGDRLDDTTVALSWSQPGDLGDDTFISYDIYYRVAGAVWPSSPNQIITNVNTTSTTVVGLTQGMVYDFLIVVVTDANPRRTPVTSTDPTARSTTVGVPTAPSAPNDLAWLYVTDTSFVVSWAYPITNGGSPITGYSISFSPSATCSTPVLDNTTRTATCTVSGLTTGTTYSISATATNAIGTSSVQSISETTPGNPPDPGPTPGPGPSPLPPAPPIPPGPQPTPDAPLPPGDTAGDEEGRPIATTPGANSGGDQFTVTGPNFALTMTGYDGSARVPLGVGPVLRSTPGGRMVVEGGIYSFNSDVSVYLFADGGQAVQSRAAVAVASATGKTNGSGRFAVTLEVPASAATGSYTLQVNGYSLLATVRSVNVGVTIEPLPWIKAKASKRPGKTANVKVQGQTGEIPAGTGLVPMIRYKGKSNWVQGASRPEVGADGTFTWKRKFNRTAWIYFYWTDTSTMKPSMVRSNTLEYKKLVRR